MPGMMLFNEVFAGVVGYDDQEVVWHLDWAPTTFGIAPVTNTSGLPPGVCGVQFWTLMAGGAQGTATLTATVDGVAVGTPITATTTL